MKLLFAYRKPGSRWGYDRMVQYTDGVYKRMEVKGFLQACENDYDVLLFDQTLAQSILKSTEATQRVAESNIPLILCETVDGSQLGVREVLRWPSVKATLKRSVLEPPELHNQVKGRYHILLLSEAGYTVRKSMQMKGKPEPQLTPEELGKIYPLVGFGAHPNLRSLAQRALDLSTTRTYELNCVGTVQYSGSEIEAHRRRAANVVRKWPGKGVFGFGRVYAKRKYHKTVRNSKCVLSPWGWGETCHRDFEAMLLGAVLIKPRMDHVQTWPDNFQPGVTYLPCKPDFSDVHKLARHVADNWQDYREMREKARSLAIRAGQAGHMAQRLRQILERVL